MSVTKSPPKGGLFLVETLHLSYARGMKNPLSEKIIFLVMLAALPGLSACGQGDKFDPAEEESSVSATMTASSSELVVKQPVTFGDLHSESLDPACAAVPLQIPPAKDQPSAEQVKALRGKCDVEALYYGIGAAPDYLTARMCAYADLDNEDFPTISGSDVLTMIYANGQGVEKNIPLARYFSCRSYAAPAEYELRLAHLSEMEKSDKPFDFCDDITSGLMMGVCSRLSQRVADVDYEKKWDKLSGQWKHEEKARLVLLKKAAQEYFENSAGEEQDMSGSGRVSFYYDMFSQLQDKFIGDMSLFENGELPRASDEDFSKADAALNLTYSRLIRELKESEARALADKSMYGDFGSIKADGIRTTQRSWLAYRDAWAAFGRMRYPGVSENAWKDYFTRQREKDLREILSLKL